MFARKIRVEIVSGEGAVPCPMAWLDSFLMRSFTGRSAFDETLPVADGELEAGFRVEAEALRRDMEDWFTRKSGKPVKLAFTEGNPQGAPRAEGMTERAPGRKAKTEGDEPRAG